MKKSAVILAGVGIALTLWVATDTTAAVEPEPVLMVEDIQPIEIDRTAEASAWLAERGVNVPESIAFECEAAGMHYDLCPELLEAIAWKESRFTPTAKNGSFVGMMQMHKSIHKDRIETFGTDPFDPHASIWAAASLLHDLSEEYATEGEPADAAVILAAYHGEDNPVGRDPSSYTRTVLEVSEALERIHGK